MTRHGEEADETPASEEIEFPQAAFLVHGAADPHGVRPEGGEFCCQPLDLGDGTWRQSTSDVLLARV